MNAIYQDGFRACVNGENRNSGPVSGEERREWAMGWDDARSHGLFGRRVGS